MIKKQSRDHLHRCLLIYFKNFEDYGIKIIGTQNKLKLIKMHNASQALGGLLSYCKLRLNTKIHSDSLRERVLLTRRPGLEWADSTTMSRHPHFKR